MDKAAKDTLKKSTDVVFWIMAVVFILAVAFFLFFRFGPYRLINVHGPSMQPTLYDGDLIVVGGDGSIARDQIAVFSLPDQWKGAVQDNTGTNLIKRVVGLPGDTLSFQGDKIVIDSGTESFEIVEPKILQCPLPLGEEIVVPEGSYFLAGDNRVQSFDSSSAWCRGLDPMVSEDSISVHGELKLRLGWPKG